MVIPANCGVFVRFTVNPAVPPPACLFPYIRSQALHLYVAMVTRQAPTAWAAELVFCCRKDLMPAGSPWIPLVRRLPHQHTFVCVCVSLFVHLCVCVSVSDRLCVCVRMAAVKLKQCTLPGLAHLSYCHVLVLISTLQSRTHATHTHTLLLTLTHSH